MPEATITTRLAANTSTCTPYREPSRRVHRPVTGPRTGGWKRARVRPDGLGDQRARQRRRAAGSPLEPQPRACTPPRPVNAAALLTARRARRAALRRGPPRGGAARAPPRRKRPPRPRGSRSAAPANCRQAHVVWAGTLAIGWPAAAASFGARRACPGRAPAGLAARLGQRAERRGGCGRESRRPVSGGHHHQQRLLAVEADLLVQEHRVLLRLAEQVRILRV